MRLTREKIQEITGLKRKSAQVAWFRQHLGTEVPCDRRGPIMTDSAYELLLEKRLGLGSSSALPPSTRPSVRLIHHDKKAA